MIVSDKKELTAVKTKITKLENQIKELQRQEELLQDRITHWNILHHAVKEIPGKEIRSD